MSTFRRTGIYRPRFQIWFPWSVTRPWLPRLFKGADEWCNESVAVITPLGALCIFWRPGRQRTMPCPDEWDVMDNKLRADYAPCGYLWDGRIRKDGHQHLDTGVCAEAWAWLAMEGHLRK